MCSLSLVSKILFIVFIVFFAVRFGLQASSSLKKRKWQLSFTIKMKDYPWKYLGQLMRTFLVIRNWTVLQHRTSRWISQALNKLIWGHIIYWSLKKQSLMKIQYISQMKFFPPFFDICRSQQNGSRINLTIFSLLLPCHNLMKVEFSFVFQTR